MGETQPKTVLRPDLRYAAFISYSHTDERHAAWLHRALEGFRPPKALAIPAANSLPRIDKLAPVFRDREELASGADLPALITAALKGAGALIVICSPRAAQSHWVNQEIRTFRELHGGDRIFALIVDGDPADEISCFPPALLEKIGPDGEIIPGANEHLAADLRPGKDGNTLAKLKIAAGLMDVGLDDLARREQARDRKRMMAITGGSLAAAIFAIGLAAFAWVQRGEAVRQRARAETEATTATRTAEFMVDLFEVADPGEARGRSITAKEILDKGAASIETGLEGEPGVQASLMHTMGKVYTGLGLYPDAERLLREARTRGTEAGVDAIEIYETENALGYVLYEKGEFEEAGEIYERLVSQEIDNVNELNSIRAQANAVVDLGEVRVSQNRLEDARELFDLAIADLEQWKDTANETYAKAVVGRARAMVLQEDYENAEIELARANGLYEKVLGKNHYIRAQILNDLGGLKYWQGSPRAAEPLLSAALELTKFHLGSSHPETINRTNNVGRIKLELGEINEAYSLISESIQLQRDVGRAENVVFSFFLNTMGIIYSERQEFNAAQKSLTEALVLVPDNTNRLFGPIQFNFGRAQCGAGDLESGIARVREGRDALADHYAEDDWRYGVADEFESFCLAKGGARDEAITLAQSGYERLLAARGEDHYFTQRAKAWLEGLE